MSSLWTPGGEHRVEREQSPSRADDPRHDHGEGPPAGGPSGPLDERGGDPDFEHMGPEEQAAMAEQMAELRRELLSAPAEFVVANHAYGLFELAAIHLSQRPPGIESARMAIDAMAALVEGLTGRLGEPEPALRDALAQIRMAFVEISGAAGGDDSGGKGSGGQAGGAHAPG